MKNISIEMCNGFKNLYMHIYLEEYIYITIFGMDTF